MSNKKWVDGPWRWSGDNCLESTVRLDDVIGVTDGGAMYESYGRPMIEHHFDADVKAANMALIAAAPELYEALEGLAEWVMQGDYDASFLSAAITAMAKARGES